MREKEISNHVALNLPLSATTMAEVKAIKQRMAEKTLEFSPGITCQYGIRKTRCTLTRAK